MSSASLNKKNDAESSDKIGYMVSTPYESIIIENKVLKNELIHKDKEKEYEKKIVALEIECAHYKKEIENMKSENTILSASSVAIISIGSILAGVFTLPSVVGISGIFLVIVGCTLQLKGKSMLEIIKLKKLNYK